MLYLPKLLVLILLPITLIAGENVKFEFKKKEYDILLPKRNFDISDSQYGSNFKNSLLDVQNTNMGKYKDTLKIGSIFTSVDCEFIETDITSCPIGFFLMSEINFLKKKFFGRNHQKKNI